MGDGGGEGVRVLPDAQAGLVATLRPYQNFESVYQGFPGSIPIMFTVGGQILDGQAGKPDYSPFLLAGLPTPIGARVALWLPYSGDPSAGGSLLAEVYNWTLVWRIRNVADFRQTRTAFHYPKQGPGASNSVGPDAGPRFVIPAMYQSIVFSDPGPRRVGTAAGGPGVFMESACSRLTADHFQPPRLLDTLDFGRYNRPVLPSGATGVFEQGLVDSSLASGDVGLPAFLAVDVTAMGDDMLLACTKDATSGNASATWNFNSANADLPFSRIFGQGGTVPSVTPLTDIGIYVMTVMAP
jgi:hypothetical protein